MIALSGPARADLLSPGELARAHAGLEGLSHCTDCHVAGEKLAADRCLACHKEIATRLSARLGFHGRLGETVQVN
jgi:uncharacterized paraquat-inducible protein A